MAFNTYMAYDKETKLYNRKETTLSLLLVSFRKLDEEKMVGRVSVDLADVLNNNSYGEPEKHKLAYCSVRDASLKFSVVCSKAEKTDLKPY